ncbi:copper-translocating p-type atpase [Ophiostoma piceae UAMH 11346]|uniref:Copper-translocating P-type atpase n=1 Tax=Ophiostoma piceae (strain UAMH 11346) TaxID=1262450 RepID=S3C3I4_OPHP1|nr:copper-translocating p-type atpase [Ophiostoma piceae UAMH 11346]
MACGSGCCGPPGDSGDKPEINTGAGGVVEGDGITDEDVNREVDKEANEDPAEECADACCAPADESGCCGDAINKDDKDACSDAEQKQKKPAAEDCGSTCCGPKETSKNCIYDCCASTKTAKVQACAESCCTPKAPKSNVSSCSDGCCSPTKAAKEAIREDIKKTAAQETYTCIDDCCASKTKSLQAEGRPSCCEGKTAPCCDDSCIDRIALRECKSGDSCASRDAENGKPCREHQRKTHSQYAASLAALGCICRALVALGQESCCVPANKGKAKQRGKPVKYSRPVDSCCNDGSCSKTEPAKPAKPAKPGTPANYRSTGDPEKAIEKEHVVLSISGMTCTGCETKLLRTLGTHPAVASLKTSLVLSRAEFDLAGHGHSVDDVMKHVERTTEFKCENISSQGGHATLDICVPPAQSVAVLAQYDWPDGVLETKVVGKRTICITFDPKVIGARDLLTKGWVGMDNDEQKRLALAPLRPDPALDAGSKHVRHIGYLTLASILLTVPVLVLAWAPLADHPIRYGSASLVLATIVQVAIAGPFYPKALKALVFSRVIEMDLLVVLSTTTAYVFSVVSFVYKVVGQPLSTGSFFETSTLLVTLIMLGRWVAALARQKAVESISIRSLQTPTAVLFRDDKIDDTIDARLLQYGDVFKVMPDSKIPTDGTVIEGTSEVNEAMITGEARPVPKETKSALIAGSINSSGTLYARVTRLPGDNTISTIAAMVDEAKLSKPRIQALADQVASYFVPVIVGLTVVTFCVWMAIGMRGRKHSASEAAIQAVTYAMTVLIVSCPCAVGLAVPMVVVIASGVAAERGVVFKSAEAIEVMHKVTHVVLDKTGTVTQGRLTVAKEWFADTLDTTLEIAPENALGTKSLLLGLLDGIKHPVSKSVVDHLVAQGTTGAPVRDKKALPGQGVEGSFDIKSLQAGNSRWLGLGDHAVVQSMLSDGLTTFCFVVDGSVAAIMGLADTPRPEAAATIASLADNGIAVHLVSGDDDGAVQLAANQLSIVPANVRSRCSPADKREYIQNLLASKKETVVFVGDGTNDAAAIAQATVGVHINSDGGTEVAQSAADVVLLRPDLNGLLVARAVSRKAVHRIVFNFGWSFVYNLFAILLATGVFEAVSTRNVRIPPEYAGLGELVSVLPVVVAATLLRWAKY